jgi:hypothetical protein
MLDQGRRAEIGFWTSILPPRGATFDESEKVYATASRFLVIVSGRGIVRAARGRPPTECSALAITAGRRPSDRRLWEFRTDCRSGWPIPGVCTGSGVCTFDHGFTPRAMQCRSRRGLENRDVRGWSLPSERRLDRTWSPIANPDEFGVPVERGAASAIAAICDLNLYANATSACDRALTNHPEPRFLPSGGVFLGLGLLLCMKTSVDKNFEKK